MRARRIRVKLPLLDQLRRVDREAARLFPRQFDPGLAAVGLIGLDEDMIDTGWRYEFFTPLNCRVFATTGGNGVHFSLLVQRSTIDDHSPVVVTIPPIASYVVGENLLDFLSLGKDRGYFALEQLAYNLELALEVYTNPQWQPTDPHHGWVGYDQDDYKRQVLRFLKSRLNLHDWGPPEKFNQLQEKYQELLKYPDGY